jgi:DNA-binding transcriptional LysR family regulator
MNAKVDLNDAALFVRVVRAASFSAAAKEIGVPVSTVSRRVARLETALGARLLERTTRRLRLTDVGRTYAAHAERAVDDLSAGRDRVRALDVVPRGRVRLTAPVGLGRMLVDALAPYLAANPAVHVEIDLSERKVDLLDEGIDIALRAGPVDTPDFVGRQLFQSSRGLYASAAYLARRGRPRKLADLAAHDAIAMRTSDRGAVWELFEGRRRHRVAFAPRLIVNEMMAMRAAVRAGAGIALLPEPETQDLVRVLPALSGERAGMWLLYPAHRSTTAAVRSCVEHLLATMRPGS